MTLKASSYPTTRPTLNLDFAKSKQLDPRITFSRASTGTYVDGDGLIKTAASGVARFDHNPSTGESLGLLVEEGRTNLLLDSALRTSNWTLTNVTSVPNSMLTPDGTFNAVKIASTTGTWQSFLSQFSVAGITAAAHTFSVYAKAGEASWICLAGIQYGEAIAYFNLSTGVVGTRSAGSAHTITPVGNGWYRCSVTCASASSTQWGVFPSNGDATLTPAPIGQGIYVWGAQLEAGSFPTSYIPTPATFTSRASTATYYDANGTVQTANTNVARSAAFFPDSTGVMRPAGLLLEAAGTNLLTYSEQFNQWVSSYVSVSSNAVAAPDGTTTADTVVADGSSNAHWIWTSDPTLGPKTFSVFAKAGTGGFLQLLFAGDSNPYANFNLSTGAIGSVGTTSTASIQKLANGWYRCSLYTSSSIATSPYIGLITSATAVRAEANTLSTSVHLWGAQVEQSPYPTSYIPTTNATVTRSADVSSSATVTRSADVVELTGTNFSSWYNQSEGTVYMHYTRYPASVAGYPSPWVIRDSIPGAYTNGIQVFAENFNTYDRLGGTNISTTPAVTLSNPYSRRDKNAAAFKAGSLNMAVNGTVGTASTNNIYVNGSVNKLVFGTSMTFGCLTYWPTRLSDATLQAITR